MSTLLDRPAIAVNQKAKLFELRNQYVLHDEDGQPIGTVEQVRQSPLAVLARVFSDLDVALPVTLEVTDVTGATALELHKGWFTMTVQVRQADGTPLGRVQKRIRLGKARFDITDAAGAELGEVRAENWRARDFAIVDPTGREVARVTKKWRGIMREALTDADSYVVAFQPDTREPMRTLAFGAALAIDVIMKQKDSG